MSEKLKKMEHFNKELKEKNEYAKQAIEMKNSQIYELKIEIDEKDFKIKNLDTNLVENVCLLFKKILNFTEFLNCGEFSMIL